MAGGLSFLTGAVVGANEIAEDNLKQKNKLKEIQWQLSRQAAFDTIKKFQETYASEEAKARQAEQSMRALAAKGLHPVAINKAFEMGMDLSKPETEEYIRGMKITPRAVQTAQPNAPVSDANPLGMPTTNSQAMQGNPQAPQGTGATGGGSGAFPEPKGIQPTPQQQQTMQPGMNSPAAQNAQKIGMNLQNVQGGNPTAPMQTQAQGAMPTQDGGIVRGKPKNLPNLQPLQNAYETLGYKGADLNKQMAPYQTMSNSRVQPLQTGPEQVDIQLPPPKSLQDASQKAESLVMQNLTRINSAQEAVQAWTAFMKSFQVNDADIARVRPAFEQAPESFWKDPETKKKIEDYNQKALAWQGAQQAMRDGKPDLAQRLLVGAGFDAGNVMTMNTGTNKGELPTLERREPAQSKSALDPNPGFNQIRAGLQRYYPSNVLFNPTSQQIELKNLTPELRDEINAVSTRAERIYQRSLREEGGKIVSATPSEALDEAYKQVSATKVAFNKFVSEINKTTGSKKGNIISEEDRLQAREQALAKLSPRERALVIQRLIEIGDQE